MNKKEIWDKITYFSNHTRQQEFSLDNLASFLAEMDKRIDNLQFRIEHDKNFPKKVYDEKCYECKDMAECLDKAESEITLTAHAIMNADTVYDAEQMLKNYGEKEKDKLQQKLLDYLKDDRYFDREEIIIFFKKQ